MSASRTVSGRSAAKCRSSRFGATGRSWRLSVVRGGRRRPLAGWRGPSRASAAPRAVGGAAAPPDAARRDYAVSRARTDGPRRCGRCGRAARPPPRPGPGRRGSRAARRGSRTRPPRRSGAAWRRQGSAARRRRTRTGSRDPPARKAAAFFEDLDRLLQPPVLALEPPHVRLLGLAGGRRPRRARGQVLVPPAAQLPRAEAGLGRGLRQALAALEQALGRLGLDLGGEPPSLLPLRHIVLLG